MNERCVLTVSTYEYLPKAIVLGESYFEHNQNTDFFILVPDLSRRQIQEKEWPVPPNTHIIGGDALNHPEMGNIQKYFSAFELCCAAKSLLMHHVLVGLGYKKALFLDPDEMCFGSFDEIWTLLDKEDILVSPHSFAPFPDDGEDPNDFELLTSGFINAGFWGIRNSLASVTVLEWVIKKVVKFGFFWPSKNLYSDQNWISCLPWYFPNETMVLRHPGVNIAYWNLHERELEKVDGRLTCNGKTALFIHFSGFDENRPQRLTRHSGRKFSEKNETLISKLAKDYSSRLQNTRGQLPQAVPDIPCSTLPLSSRLKIFQQCRGHVLQSLLIFNESSFLERLIRFIKKILQ